MSENLKHCSFCSKSEKEVKKLIAGVDVYICDECVNICQDVLESDSLPKIKNDLPSASLEGKLPTPLQIKTYLDQYVIGQDHAKTILSVAVYNHYKRVSTINDGDQEVELDKSNMLMVGPSGTGKSLLAKSIAKLLNVPFVIADATTMSEVGFVGNDIDSVLSSLLSAAGGDIKKAEIGIVFIDEIDKKRKKGEDANSRDVSGEGVQQGLLKMIEGTEVMIAQEGMKRHPLAPMIKINTQHILFIVAGAFVGLDKLVNKRISKAPGIGFNSINKSQLIMSTGDLLKRVEPDDLINYGLIPELVGRLPALASLSDLNEDQLIKVLTEPKNALIKQYIKLFKMDGIELEFEPDAISKIAKIASIQKTGARGLKTVLEQKLTDVQFKLPELRESGIKKVVISKEFIENELTDLEMVSRS